MGDDHVTTPVVVDCNPATAVEAGTDEIKLLALAVQELPALAVKELITHEVCARCIFRVFSIHEGIYASISPTTLYSIIEKATELEDVTTKSSQKSEVKSNICSICLGVMQFRYHDQQDMLVEKSHAADFAMTVAESVKEHYPEIAGFTLEVSLPSLITQNESFILSYMKKKYASEVWFREKFSFENIISVKDALKSSVTHSLEILLGVKSSVSDFRIRLTYEHVDSGSAENGMGKNQSYKRIKSGDGLVKCTNNETLQDSDVSEFNFQLKKVGQPCHMTLTCSMAPVYIGGRYLKLSRNVSQTRWIIDDERKGDASVEEIIGGNILPLCYGDGYKFHAAGREDIDVRMLGSGRPFLIEIQNPRHLPSEASVKEMEKKLNSIESSNLVRVKHMKILGSQGWSLMREGETEKQKQYVALVWISRSINDNDLEAVLSLKDLKVLQRTPIRVLHRRSPLDREKIIHWMKIEKIAGSCQYFLLHLCTQAGTYIKEFVHGDLGRTHPSIGSILRCRAEILRLDVTEVKMDILNE